MCAIIGCVLAEHGAEQADRVLRTIFARSIERGRDGWGYYLQQDGMGQHERHNSMYYPMSEDGFFHDPVSAGTLIGNMRAEPTTEYVRHKKMTDQQPYRLGEWTVVHNGTIANDAFLRSYKVPTAIDSAAIVERLNAHEPRAEASIVFYETIRELKGSYAILATRDDETDAIYVACNYRPIWWATDGSGVYFASSRDYFPDNMVPIMVPPYSIWRFDPHGGIRLDSTPVPEQRQKVLVVCSGGLDSTVAATKMVRDGHDVTLLHFRYGSRAEDPEYLAVKAIARELGIESVCHQMNVYKPEDSPLLQADSAIAGGEAGAEFAHEWVPARNLLMLATATALAEAGGYELIVLGNNLEEAGAYPDNEPEFIARFNDVLPFAVGDGKRVSVVMPVGNLMKHEIVALGHEIEAPLHLTWSCYRAEEQHCGTCGPCFMRRTAFEINGLPEVIQYANRGPE